jgi:O-antigen ligase
MSTLQPANAAVPDTGAESHRPSPALIVTLLGLVAGLAIHFGSAAGALVFFVILAAAPMLLFPFLALNVLVAFCAFDAINTLVPSAVYTVTATKLVGVLMATSLAIHLARGRRGIRLDGAMLLLGALVVLIVASGWAATNMQMMIADGLRIVQLAVLFVAFRELVTSRWHLRMVARTLVASLAVAALLALVEGAEAGERISGVSQNAAIMAADLFVALAMAMALFLTSSAGGRRLVIAVALILIGWVLAITETRAAFLAIPPALLAAFFATRRVNPFITLVAVIVLAGFVALGGIAGRIEAARTASDNSTRGHLRTLKAGVEMIEDYPLLGVGFGNFREHYLRYSNDPLGLAKTAHNSYVSFGAELGVGGLVLWPGFMLLCVLHLLRAARVSRLAGDQEAVTWQAMILFAVVGAATMSFFHTLHFSKYLWMLLALASTAGQFLAPASDSDEAAPQ